MLQKVMGSEIRTNIDNVFLELPSSNSDSTRRVSKIH